MVPLELHFPVKLLKSTFKRENTGCTIHKFSAGLVEEGIFRTGLKQKSPVLREQGLVRFSHRRGHEVVTDPARQQQHKFTPHTGWSNLTDFDGKVRVRKPMCLSIVTTIINKETNCRFKNKKE